MAIGWRSSRTTTSRCVRPTRAPAEAEQQTILLSQDGSEGNYYALDTLAWSPDSKHLAAYRIRPGYRREVHYVESSPADQLQPKYSSMVYPKAGDVLALFQPVLFDVAAQAVNCRSTMRSFPIPMR